MVKKMSNKVKKMIQIRKVMDKIKRKILLEVVSRNRAREAAKEAKVAKIKRNNRKIKQKMIKSLNKQIINMDKLRHTSSQSRRGHRVAASARRYIIRRKQPAPSSATLS